MPPTKAAQEEIPAKTPKPKNASRDDVEFNERKSEIPIFCKNKNAAIIKMAMVKAGKIVLGFFSEEPAEARSEKV